nr:protein-lysine N-methyltransferase EEF2KMT [Onthophagus taurus]
MSQENFKKSIENIKKQFFCCVVIKNLNIESIENLSSWDNQNTLIEETVNSQQILKYPIKISYQTAFIKHIIEVLIKQNAEINDVVYDALGRLMALIDSKINFKHYLFDEERIILMENSSIISEGTTGLCTWQASLILSEWSLENKDIFMNKRVLELGSGIGLTGIVITKYCSPKKYIFTDCHDSVLKNLKENINLNLNSSNKVNEVRKVSWETVNSDTKEIYECDVTVAADVVYDSKLFLPLQNTFKFLLRRGTCSAIFLSCTERNEDTLNEFLNLLLVDNFEIENLKVPSPKYFDWDCNLIVKMFKITHKNRL